MDKTECESNCQAGICLRTGPGATFECSCNQGWGGEKCSEVIGRTCERDCEHGTCVRTDFDTTTCICDPGWEGKHCFKIADPNKDNVCLVNDPRTVGSGFKNTKFCQKNQKYYLTEKNDGAFYIDGADFSCTEYDLGFGRGKTPFCDCNVNIREGGKIKSVPTNKYPDGSCMACPPGYYATMERKGNTRKVGVVCKKSQNCDRITYEMPQTQLDKVIDGKSINNKEILGNDTYPDPVQCVPKYMYCGRYGCHVDPKDAQCTFSERELKRCPDDYDYRTRIEPHFADMPISCPIGQNIKRCEYLIKNVRPNSPGY